MTTKSEQIVYCDIDNTIFPLIETILSKYNDTYNDSLKFESVTDYDINKFVKPACKSFFKEFATEDIWINAKPYDSAVEILAEVNKSYNLYFVTAGHPNTMKFRDDWLDKWFSFYSSAQLIMIRNKQMLTGELLIDDYAGNLIGGVYKSIVFNQKWNESFDSKNRMFKWDEASIDMISNAINDNKCPHKDDWRYCLKCKNSFDDDGALYCKKNGNDIYEEQN